MNRSRWWNLETIKFNPSNFKYGKFLSVIRCVKGSLIGVVRGRVRIEGVNGVNEVDC